jgi:plastocyanin
MRKQLGKAGRRIWLVVALAVAGLMLASGLAFAASATIVGQTNNTFSAGLYSTDQGEVSQLQVTGSMHNVTAVQTGPDGKPLFRSSTVSGGLTPVSGTQYLPAGAYQFFCSIHPTTMTGTLQVTSNGTPQARPQATLKLTTRKLSKVLKQGLSVSINASAKVIGVNLVAKLGKTTIGSSNNLAWIAGQQFEKVPLTKAGKSKLRGKSKATVTLTAEIPFAAPASTKGKLT